jgi:hypothetical protein
MFIRAYRCPPDCDECYTLDEQTVNPGLLPSVALAFALCAGLNRRVDRQAYKVAAYFFPDMERFQAKQIEAALGQLLAGEMPPGEADMANFAEGSPFLAGHLSVQSHAIYKLVVGFAHAPHGRVAFSPGDCLDVLTAYEAYRAVLDRNGYPHGPVGETMERIITLFGQAAHEVGGFVEIHP